MNCEVSDTVYWHEDGVAFVWFRVRLAIASAAAS